MRFLKCILMKNGCYTKYHKTVFQPVGAILHSTDPATGEIRRYAQPYSGQTSGLTDNGTAVTANQMIKILGKNQYDNDWNRATTSSGSTLEKCVHGFIGKLADGSYAACQTLPFTQPCWGAGAGSKGSYNGCQGGKAKEPLYIQIEMIEDSASSKNHCKALYDTAVEYLANLCVLFPTIKLENIISHNEAYKRGCASNHGDPESYWKRVGVKYSMDGFRADVKKKLAEITAGESEAKPVQAPDPVEKIYRVRKAWEDNNSQLGAYKSIENARANCPVNYYVFDENGNNVYTHPNTTPAWATASCEKAVKKGVIQGDGNGMLYWSKPMTRGQLVTILYRTAGEPEFTTDKKFSDVEDGRYYTKAVSWAAENNIVNGYDDGTFKPDAPISREQIATILYRYEGMPDVTGEMDFPDAGQVGAYAKDAMLWTTQNAYIAGVKTANGIFLRPKDNATRAQVVVVIDRIGLLG